MVFRKIIENHRNYVVFQNYQKIKPEKILEG
jgi:hypothetical protein